MGFCVLNVPAIDAVVPEGKFTSIVLHGYSVLVCESVEEVMAQCRQSAKDARRESEEVMTKLSQQQAKTIAAEFTDKPEDWNE